MTRLGVPLIVVVFYITASLQFSYTPESTYTTLREAEKLQVGVAAIDHVPGLPWFGLAVGAAKLHIDPIVSAKVFSLLFGSLAVVLAFFLVYELTGDLVIGICGALAVASQNWLIRSAAGGSGTSLVFVLVLLSLIFMARNEYLLAVLCASVGALAQWPVLGLLPVVAIDAVVNSRDRRRGTILAFAITLVALAVLLPWILAASWWNLPVLTSLPSASSSPTLVMWWVFGIMTILALVGIFLRLKSEHRLRGLPDFPGVWLASAWLVATGLLVNQDLLAYAIAVVILLGFTGLQRIVRKRQGNDYSFGMFVVCTALLLAGAQAEFYLQTKPAMDATIEDNDDLTAIAYWLQSGREVGQTSCAVRPATLSHFLQYDVPPIASGTHPATLYVVSQAEDLAGYDIAYAPGGPGNEDPGGEQHQRFRVWRKK
jgi:hypothetical protein